MSEREPSSQINSINSASRTQLPRKTFVPAVLIAAVLGGCIVDEREGEVLDASMTDTSTTGPSSDGESGMGRGQRPDARVNVTGSCDHHTPVAERPEHCACPPGAFQVIERNGAEICQFCQTEGIGFSAWHDINRSPDNCP